MSVMTSVAAPMNPPRALWRGRAVVTRGDELLAMPQGARNVPRVSEGFVGCPRASGAGITGVATDRYARVYCGLRLHTQPRRDLHDDGLRFLLDCEWKAVSYTHLRAHETPEHLVCRLL